ncbi:MAG TPA: GGDEF domain-containing protein [Pirellulales bacterium]|nr:GGDEF domain-containing protein [Pirellulales bacterium]
MKRYAGAAEPHDTEPIELQVKLHQALTDVARLQDELVQADAHIREQTEKIDIHLAESRVDPLTGLANRRALDDELSRRLSETKRTRLAFCMMLVDLDHFKRINDTLGHDAGDSVLRQAAEAMRKTMREMDLVARFGGEEFAIVLPATDLLSGTYAAERLRKAMEQALIEVDGDALKVTISAGIAEIRADETVTMLLRRADAALYAAKSAGRNTSFLHDGRDTRPITSSKPAVAFAVFGGAEESAPGADGNDEPASGDLMMTALG